MGVSSRAGTAFSQCIVSNDLKDQFKILLSKQLLHASHFHRSSSVKEFHSQHDEAFH